MYLHVDQSQLAVSRDEVLQGLEPNSRHQKNTTTQAPVEKVAISKEEILEV
jgi:hypothetical protein